MAAKKKTAARGKAPATKKKAAAKKAPVKKAPVKKAARRGVSKITVTHARSMMGHVNRLLAEQGFSARVSELHFTSLDGDTDGCENCVPPQVCKRVCRMSPQGPVCENQCV